MATKLLQRSERSEVPRAALSKAPARATLMFTILFSARIKRDTDEIHAHLDGTSAGIAGRVRKCAEANPGSFYAVEGPKQFQN
jgi:hypothetical protein